MNTINQEFAVEILRQDDVLRTPLFTALSRAITKWEREFSEDDEEDTSFTVEDEENDSQDLDGDDEDDQEDFVVDDPSDSVLALTVTASSDVLKDIKAIQKLDNGDDYVRLVLNIIYGEQRALVKKFVIGPDLFVSMSSGERSVSPLEISVLADVYDSETIF